MLKVIGIWLNESGWSCVMTPANVTIERRAGGFMKGAYISRGQCHSMDVHT